MQTFLLVFQFAIGSLMDDYLGEYYMCCVPDVIVGWTLLLLLLFLFGLIDDIFYTSRTRELIHLWMHFIWDLFM